MKKLSDDTKAKIAAIILILFFAGLVTIKYKIWRAEHPQAKTWTFFIPDRH